MVETRRGGRQPPTRGGRQPHSSPQGNRKKTSAVTSPSPRSRKATTGDNDDDDDDDKIATRRHQPARQHAPLPPLPRTNAKRLSLPSTTRSRKKVTLNSDITSIVNPPNEGDEDSDAGAGDDEDNAKQSSLPPSTTHSRNQVTKTSTTNSVVNPPIGKDNNEGDKVNEAGDDDGARNQHNKDNEAGEDEEGVHNQNNDSDNETSGSDGTDIDADIRRITGTTCVDGF